jgi:serine/threonine-protein kinase RsbW
VGRSGANAETQTCAARGVLTQEALMHEGSITIRLPVDLKEIERLNRIVRQFGDLHEVPGRTLYAVNLALDEVVTNIVLHGFDDAAGQEVMARLTAREGVITAEVEDGGRAFNPLDAPPPNLAAPLDERALGGLGIHLVKSLMDKVEYRREGEKNVLTVRKRIR